MLNPDPSHSDSNLTLDKRSLEELDPAIFSVIEKEKIRQRTHLSLIHISEPTRPY